MIKYTITKDSDIVKVIEAGKLELAQLQVQEGQVLHNGGYSPDLYEYDETLNEFTLRAEPRAKEITELTDRQIIFILLRELNKQGFSFPSLNMIVRTKRQAKDLIDLAASRACERLVSQGKFTVFEYQLTQQQVKAWRDAGSDQANAPEMLKSWLDNSVFTTVEGAAVNIEQTATQFNNVIADTRRLRLQGKKAVDDETGDYKAIMQSFIDQLEKIGTT